MGIIWFLFPFSFHFHHVSVQFFGVSLGTEMGPTNMPACAFFFFFLFCFY